jgi:predicted TIM-barrel fold metal-dependent hydrolase
VNDDLGPVVDVHHHWLPIEIIATLEQQLPEGYRVIRRDEVARVFDDRGNQVFVVDALYHDLTRQLADMDAAGIDVALLSGSCFPSWITLTAARLINDAAADVLRRHGTRLRPMIHVPPFGQAGILEEMARAAKLGLRGVCICTNYRGAYPDQDVYLPFLQKAADLDLVVFVHAAGAPVNTTGLDGYDLVRTLGRSLDHCLVTVRMLYSGVLAAIPGLRMVMPHLGGSFYAQTRRFLESPRQVMTELPPGQPDALLDRLLFDTAPAVWHGTEEIGFAVDRLGVDRVAMGSDYPVGSDASWLVRAVESIRQLPLATADKQKLAGRNAIDFYRM